MTTYSVAVTADIAAPPAQVYAVISDYHEGHRAILPERYFEEMKVVEGGQGAGTVVSVAMKVMGTRPLFQLTVSEPEPGRVLREVDPQAGVDTTFTVEPLKGGSQSRVTIATSARTSPGLKGFIEKLINPAITRRIYREELTNLADYMRSNGSVDKVHEAS